MYSRPIVPANFTVPLRLEGDGFYLRMLSVHDLVQDFDAVIASRESIRRIMPPGEKWPEGLTITENLIDLGWHEREFSLRSSFAYTVVASDESQCLGCCYIDPSDRQGFEVTASYWVSRDQR